jgi:hypothetical protein
MQTQNVTALAYGQTCFHLATTRAYLRTLDILELTELWEKASEIERRFVRRRKGDFASRNVAIAENIILRFYSYQELSRKFGLSYEGIRRVVSDFNRILSTIILVGESEDAFLRAQLQRAKSMEDIRSIRRIARMLETPGPNPFRKGVR